VRASSIYIYSSRRAPWRPTLPTLTLAFSPLTTPLRRAVAKEISPQWRRWRLAGILWRFSPSLPSPLPVSAQPPIKVVQEDRAGIARVQLISCCAVRVNNVACLVIRQSFTPCRRSVQIVHHHQQLRVHGVAGDPVRRRFGRAGQHGLRARAGSVADALRAGGVVGPRVGPDPLLRGRHDDGQVRLRDGRLRVRPRWPSSRSTAAAAWTSTT
jgi:hypothetical protein